MQVVDKVSFSYIFCDPGIKSWRVKLSPVMLPG